MSKINISNSAAVDFRSIKAAAIYFDYVIPVFPMINISDDVVRDYNDILTRKQPGVSPDEIGRQMCDMTLRHGGAGLTMEESIAFIHPKLVEEYRAFATFSFVAVASMIPTRDPDDWDRRADFTYEAIDIIKDLRTRMNVEKLPLLRFSDGVDFDILPVGDDPLVEVANLHLIDPDLLTFEQLNEIRNDAAARLQLQTFRSFVRENLAGKSRAEVEDAIGKSMLAYQTAARKHGAGLAISTLSSIIGSSAVMAGLSAALGIDLVAEDSLGAGLGVVSAGLAGVTLSVGKSLSARRHGLVTHEMAYFNTVRQHVSTSAA